MKPEADVYKNLKGWEAFLPSLNPANWFKTYEEVLQRFSIVTYMANSVFYAVTFAVGSILINSLAGFAFARINFTGKKWLFGFLLALLIIPGEMMLIPQFTIINALGLVNSRLAVIIPGLASVFNIYLFRNFFNFGGKFFARTAPFSPKIDQNGGSRIDNGRTKVLCSDGNNLRHDFPFEE